MEVDFTHTKKRKEKSELQTGCGVWKNARLRRHTAPSSAKPSFLAEFYWSRRRLRCVSFFPVEIQVIAKCVYIVFVICTSNRHSLTKEPEAGDSRTQRGRNHARMEFIFH